MTIGTALGVAALVMASIYFLLGEDGRHFVLSKGSAYRSYLRLPRSRGRRLLKSSVKRITTRGGSGGVPANQIGVLYAQGAISFTQRDVERLAAQDFVREPWKQMLVSHVERDLGTHIRQAHGLLADLALSRTSVSKIVSIFEIGPGSGEGSLRVLERLVNRPSLPTIEYSAIDISRYWCGKTESLLQEKLSLSKSSVTVRASVKRAPTYGHISRLRPESFDLAIAGYSLHHNLSLGVILSSLCSLPRILSCLGSKRNVQAFRKTVLRTLCSLAKGRRKRKEVASLASDLLQEAGKANSGEGRLQSFLVENDSSLRGLLLDPRREIIRAVACALKPKGVFIIADPDGRSWFNKHEILQPGEECIAAANLCDKERTIADLEEAGLAVIDVYVQWDAEKNGERKLQDVVELQRDMWKQPVDELPGVLFDTAEDATDVDRHLGYVVCAKRPD